MKNASKSLIPYYVFLLSKKVIESISHFCAFNSILNNIWGIFSMQGIIQYENNWGKAKGIRGKSIAVSVLVSSKEQLSSYDLIKGIGG